MSTIYIRTLKNVEHSVFCVEDGQKTYFDPKVGRRIPYSSGQQVKRSILGRLNCTLNTPGSPTTFIFNISKTEEIKEGEVYGTCNPIHADQLFGGWMKAGKGGVEKTLKRRSPLSISAMRALHPKLAGTDKENISFDRTERANNKIIVRDIKGNELTHEEIKRHLLGKDRSLSRKWIPDNTRASGLFVMDMAIDLRRLFCVSLNHFEPEITLSTESFLKENGWIESENIFGRCLITPKRTRQEWIPAIVDAILNWRITSNQSRTFSLMETLAVTVSDNANRIAGSIRTKLTEDDKVKPIIQEAMNGVESFVTLPAAGYILTTTENENALELAKEFLIRKIEDFNHENQI